MSTSQETLINSSSTFSPLNITPPRRISRERQLALSRTPSPSLDHHFEVSGVNETQPGQYRWTEQEHVHLEAPRWVMLLLRLTGRLLEKIPGVRVKFHSTRRT
ncbi:hypothetical protein CPB83DRAFT_893313 [Crepidotus variabilis]|uniref:Uncharacterized protein n=1 Tax=Crepidotus variabilis TaxID=179855 RepID=A0A9P6JQM0_9AGAR|nr:hypothetical protein CPB83DRAFT_893313 [Crepidotus variabilis]